MDNLVRAANNILLAVGEIPPNKKLIRAAFALQEALSEQALVAANLFTYDQVKAHIQAAVITEREACAKVCDELDKHFDYTIAARQCAAAIRAIKFEGDTGFRPVSEMIAEHKQDPKKAAAIEKAKMRKAEQKPVAYLCSSFVDNFATGRYETCEQKDYGAFPVYAAPVRTKNLTDAEIWEIVDNTKPLALDFARAVIAADREKNK